MERTVWSSQIVAYLEAFADAFDLRRLLRLGVRVANVRQLRDDPPPSGSIPHRAASGGAGRAGSGDESHSCAANPQTQSGAGGLGWRVLIGAANAQDSSPGQVTGQRHRCRWRKCACLRFGRLVMFPAEGLQDEEALDFDAVVVCTGCYRHARLHPFAAHLTCCHPHACKVASCSTAGFSRQPHRCLAKVRWPRSGGAGGAGCAVCRMCLSCRAWTSSPGYRCTCTTTATPTFLRTRPCWLWGPHFQVHLEPAPAPYPAEFHRGHVPACACGTCERTLK